MRLDDGRAVRLHLPIGLREGERLSVDGRVLTVSIAGDGKAAVMGDHLCLTVRVEPGMLRQGGRLTVETPAGKLAESGFPAATPCAAWCGCRARACPAGASTLKATCSCA